MSTPGTAVMKRNLAGLLAAAILAASAGEVLLASQELQPPAARANQIFERWNRRDSPGCAFSVGRGGRTVLSRAYGMANLEYEVPLTPQSVFEAGSVSKQVTAAAVVLLALDGKLSLDDPVRKVLPEVPDFGGQPIRIRHLLTHTSGLRSQWPLLTLAGRPPGSAVHTIPEILVLVSRQRALNFAPGEEFLYNNTGFTLLSVIVARVSGQSFQEFCDRRLFKPIGMASTRWREDHSTVVKGRATAYGRGRDGSFHTEMSFTNVVGNGGLLTTVGDLFLWNQNLDSGKVGGRRMADDLETAGVLNDGCVPEDGKGLYLRRYRGLREVSHGGSTAGYRAFLARYPEKQFSVAVLCNVASATPDVYAHQLVDLFLQGELEEPKTARAAAVAAGDLKPLAGLYREPATGAVERVVFEKDRLRVGVAEAGAMELIPMGANRFGRSDGALEFLFEPAGQTTGMRLTESGPGNKPRSLVRVPQATPSPDDLASYSGLFYSDELEVGYIIGVDQGRFFALHPPDPGVLLSPLDADAFDFGQGRVIRFTRDRAGTVDGLEVYAGRVRHVRFVKRAGAS